MHRSAAAAVSLAARTLRGLRSVRSFVLADAFAFRSPFSFSTLSDSAPYFLTSSASASARSPSLGLVPFSLLPFQLSGISGAVRRACLYLRKKATKPRKPHSQRSSQFSTGLKVRNDEEWPTQRFKAYFAWILVKRIVFIGSLIRSDTGF